MLQLDMTWEDKWFYARHMYDTGIKTEMKRMIRENFQMKLTFLLAAIKSLDV